MRYVNCATSETEQNLVAFQYKGEIYYRTYKKISTGNINKAGSVFLQLFSLFCIVSCIGVPCFQDIPSLQVALH